MQKILKNIINSINSKRSKNVSSFVELDEIYPNIFLIRLEDIGFGQVQWVKVPVPEKKKICKYFLEILFSLNKSIFHNLFYGTISTLNLQNSKNLEKTKLYVLCVGH